MRKIIILLSVLLLICSCSGGNVRVAGSLNEDATIYPEYKDVTIPPNIAPLDFCVAGGASGKFSLLIEGGDLRMAVRGDGGGNFEIPEKRWRNVLSASRGKDISFTICRYDDGKWMSYDPFVMHVAEEEIDPYLAYRLIPPGYGLWRKMGIYQRNLETYAESPIVENELTDNNCMNCHSFPNRNPSKMVLHMRAKNAGTLLMDGNSLEKLNTKTPETISALVYPYWHPSERFIAFSNNSTAQSFFMNHPNRIEVFDSNSDVVVYDVERHEIFSSPLLKSKASFETFPAFSPDGKSLYFCSSAAVDSMPARYKEAHYSLCRIDFDPESRSFGSKADTLYSAGDSLSVSFPRVSPDGRFLVFTRHHFGNFSIWHKDADLWGMELRSGQAHPLEEANSNDVESYHSWSSNSRWLVFSSRRGDGLYTRPYFSYMDSSGKAHKPFLLPQRRPKEYYDEQMFSYNIPELVAGKVKAGKHAISSLMRKDPGTDVVFSGDAQ